MPNDVPEVSQGRYQRIFGVLFALTKLVNTGASLPELLRAVAVHAVELLGADSCSVMMLDDARTALLCKASHGLDPAGDDALHFALGEGVAGWVAEHAVPARIGEVSSDPRYVALPDSGAAIASLLAVPLCTRDGVIGVISVSSAAADAFTAAHQDLLVYLGGSIVKDIESARLYRLSIGDALTKAYNRQYLFGRLPEEIDRARRYGDPLSVVLFELDDFKALCDRHGTSAGDFVLKEVVRAAQATVREVDAVVRTGTESFLLLLPKTARAGAALTAERLRAALGAMDLPWGEAKLAVTAGYGAVQLADAENDEAFLQRADRALAAAKQAGPDRVVAG